MECVFNGAGSTEYGTHCLQAALPISGRNMVLTGGATPPPFQNLPPPLFDRWLTPQVFGLFGIYIFWREAPKIFLYLPFNKQF